MSPVFPVSRQHVPPPSTVKCEANDVVVMSCYENALGGFSLFSNDEGLIRTQASGLSVASFVLFVLFHGTRRKPHTGETFQVPSPPTPSSRRNQRSNQPQQQRKQQKQQHNTVIHVAGVIDVIIACQPKVSLSRIISICLQGFGLVPLQN